jgi:ketosteroid isomerase-like protein
VWADRAADNRKAEGTMDQSTADTFQPILADYVAALNAVANGDSGPVKTLCSQRDDISQCGLWGGVEQGWPEVSERWDWVAAQFVPGPDVVVTLEPSVSSVNGAVAYGVFIERWHAQYGAQTEPQDTMIRVTLIFRQEDGVWKAVHRHGDGLLTKSPPR